MEQLFKNHEIDDFFGILKNQKVIVIVCFLYIFKISDEKPPTINDNIYINIFYNIYICVILDIKKYIIKNIIFYYM